MRYILIALMFLPGIAMGADALGRLFTTPAERASLDYLRQTKKIEMHEADKPAHIDVAPAAPSSFSVQGYVKRSDGKKGTVWVNNSPIQENSSASGIQVGKLGRDGNRVELKMPANGKSLHLKAGQTYLPGSDSISDIGAHVAAPSSTSQDSGTLSTEPAAKSKR